MNTKLDVLVLGFIMNKFIEVKNRILTLYYRNSIYVWWKESDKKHCYLWMPGMISRFEFPKRPDLYYDKVYGYRVLKSGVDINIPRANKVVQHTIMKAGTESFYYLEGLVYKKESVDFEREKKVIRDWRFSFNYDFLVGDGYGISFKESLDNKKYLRIESSEGVGYLYE